MPAALSDWLAERGLVGGSRGGLRPRGPGAGDRGPRGAARAAALPTTGGASSNPGAGGDERRRRPAGTAHGRASTNGRTGARRAARRRHRPRARALLGIVARAQADGTWERMKACPWHTCHVGVLRPLPQPLAHVVLDGGLRQPREGADLPAPRLANGPGGGLGALDQAPSASSTSRCGASSASRPRAARSRCPGRRCGERRQRARRQRQLDARASRPSRRRRTSSRSRQPAVAARQRGRERLVRQPCRPQLPQHADVAGADVLVEELARGPPLLARAGRAPRRARAGARAARRSRARARRRAGRACRRSGSGRARAHARPLGDRRACCVPPCPSLDQHVARGIEDAFSRVPGRERRCGRARRLDMPEVVALCLVGRTTNYFRRQQCRWSMSSSSRVSSTTSRSAR